MPPHSDWFRWWLLSRGGGVVLVAQNHFFSISIFFFHLRVNSGNCQNDFTHTHKSCVACSIWWVNIYRWASWFVIFLFTTIRHYGVQTRNRIRFPPWHRDTSPSAILPVPWFWFMAKLLTSPHPSLTRNSLLFVHPKHTYTPNECGTGFNPPSLPSYPLLAK